MEKPKNEFHSHVNCGFGSDKAGVVEYSGVELGFFLEILLKANPRNLEFLFCDTNRVIHQSWVWDELREMREVFLTRRAVGQYFGMVKDRLKKAKKSLLTIHAAKEKLGQVRFSALSCSAS
jgi:hypothetical protein